MSDGKIISALVECKKYKDNIMDMIISLLTDNGYEIRQSENNGELLVKTNNLSQINNIIANELDVPDNVKDVLIDTYQTCRGIYIRIKFR
jgi:ATP phosphoribosyltransferase